MSIKFTEDEFDLFAELINVAMGRSAADLAKLFNHFVELKVPTISIASSESIPQTVIENSMFNEGESVTVVQQKFFNSDVLNGRGVILFSDNTKQAILPLLDLTLDDIESDDIYDFLLELSGQLIGSCLSNLFNQFFKTVVKFSSPEMISEDQTLRHVAYSSFELDHNEYGDILCSKINFVINKVDFQCDLFFFIDTKSLGFLQKSLQETLSEMF